MWRASNISGGALVRLLGDPEISKPLKRSPARAERLLTTGNPGRVVSKIALLLSCTGRIDFWAVECWKSRRAYGVRPAHSGKWYSDDAVNDQAAPSSASPLSPIRP